MELNVNQWLKQSDILQHALLTLEIVSNNVKHACIYGYNE